MDELALQQLASRVAHSLELATNCGKCGWLPNANPLWAREYARLSKGKPGLSGAMSARAEAQTLRLALIYAVLDGCNNIGVSHLEAALEVWRYCQDSVDYCFGAASGNSVADSILSMLRSMPEGANQTQISNHFGRNKSSKELNGALETLMAAGHVRVEKRSGESGRAAHVWFAI